VSRPCAITKATVIRKEEGANHYGAGRELSQRNVVISHRARRYDIRVMSKMELEEFVAELLRARLSELQVPLLAPN
jgi:hypothetical protein